jgi:Zn-dependent peptidase ImmA (M78 family)
MTKLNVRFLPKSILEDEASSFLNQNKLAEIPINIEFVAECNYMIHIVPFAGLLQEYGIDGYSASDFSTIYVDEFVYNQRPTRLRFTVAHELGHRVLHEKYLSMLKFSSVDQWIEIILNNLDRSDYEKMEYQANAFAGLVLVPQDNLKVQFKNVLHSLTDLIEEAKTNGLTRNDYLDTVIYTIADELSTQFEVSLDVMTIRIKTDYLDELIP